MNSWEKIIRYSFNFYSTNPFSSSYSTMPLSLANSYEIGVVSFSSSYSTMPLSLANSYEIGVVSFSSSYSTMPLSLANSYEIGVVSWHVELFKGT